MGLGVVSSGPTKDKLPNHEPGDDVDSHGGSTFRCQTREAKIADFEIAVAIHEHIVRFKVSVHHVG